MLLWDCYSVYLAQFSFIVCFSIVEEEEQIRGVKKQPSLLYRYRYFFQSKLGCFLPLI